MSEDKLRKGNVYGAMQRIADFFFIFYYPLNRSIAMREASTATATPLYLYINGAIVRAVSFWSRKTMYRQGIILVMGIKV